MRQATITLAVTAALLTGCTASPRPQPELRVLAAASLRPVFERIAPRFERDHGVRLVFEFAASGILSKQIEAGAPADVFASASPVYVAELESAGLIRPDAVTFARNDTALFVSRDHVSAIDGPEDLAGIERFAMGDPASAPHGAQAKRWLVRLDLWDAIEGRAVYGQNAAQTVDYVAGGEVAAGIGFVSDIVHRGDVRVVAVADREDVPPARYVAGAVAASREPDTAAAFLAYLRSSAVRSELADSGFVIPEVAER